jgi:hypothetical protein
MQPRCSEIPAATSDVSVTKLRLFFDRPVYQKGIRLSETLGQCARERFFGYLKRDNLPVPPQKRTSLLSCRQFLLHSLFILASPGRRGGRSVGTTSRDPRIARVACSSSSVLVLNLI